MQKEQFDTAVAKLETAITDERGDLRPIERIEFEVLAGQVRWILWEDGRRVYVATGQPADIEGLLVATKMILEMRAADTTIHEGHEAHEGAKNA